MLIFRKIKDKIKNVTKSDSFAVYDKSTPIFSQEEHSGGGEED